MSVLAMVLEQLNLCFEIATQQGILTQHWQQFEQQRLTVQQQQISSYIPCPSTAK